MKKPTVKIESWEQSGNFLEGKVYEHPKIGEGRWVRTSAIIFLDEKLGICETCNTIYLLGEKRYI